MAGATWGSTDLGGTVGTLLTAPNLRVAYWRGPEQGPGTVIIVQGRAEFIEFYGETVADLLERGLSVVTFDFRGQGGSDRKAPSAGHIDNFRQYRDDLAVVVRFARQLNLPAPFTVLAHSMGGLVALQSQETLVRDISRMVLIAPMLEIGDLPMPKPLAGALAFGARLVGLGSRAVRSPTPRPSAETFSGNKLTSDETRYLRLCDLVADNPHLTTALPSFAWVSEALRATRQTMDAKGTPLVMPTLFVASGADRVVSTPAIDSFARATPGAGLVMIGDAGHQVVFERDELRSLFFAAFDAFVLGQPKPEDDARRSRLARTVKFEEGSTSDAWPTVAAPSRAPGEGINQSVSLKDPNEPAHAYAAPPRRDSSPLHESEGVTARHSNPVEQTLVGAAVPSKTVAGNDNPEADPLDPQEPLSPSADGGEDGDVASRRHRKKSGGRFSLRAPRRDRPRHRGPRRR